MLHPLNPLELIGGLILSALIGVIGYRREALTASGVVGAILTGTILFGLGGWEWGVLLVAFFVSSSLLSRYREADKSGLAEKFAKGHRRDLGQALANAGVGSGLAVATLFWDQPLFYVACAGAMAAVNADTWATEVGVLSKRPPRMITTGRRVEVGASGGVTALGMVATLAGAFFISVLGSALVALNNRDWLAAAAVLLGGSVGGVTGALVDSVLGATIQAIYWCDECSKETEQRIHRCGHPTRQVRGMAWLTNDWVNFIAAATGAATAATIGWVILG